MSSVVLDSSAVIAAMKHERGREAVLQVLDDAVISSVNFAEVVGKLIDDGDSEETATAKVQRAGLVVIDFDKAQALAAGTLRLGTAKHGLSLGDRACLALALRESATVMTADRAWAALDVGVEVVLIR